MSAEWQSTRRAARVAGAAYLLAIPPAVFAEFYVRGRLVAGHDAGRTAQNIVAHALLFRAGIASNLAVFALDVVLIVALYTVLRPVGPRLALVALGWRLIETAVLIVTTLDDLDALRVLSGAEYLRVLEPNALTALARLSIGAHGSAYGVGLVLAGLGSTAFAVLWLRSGFVPRVLAILGVLSSAMLAICTFAFIVVPSLEETVTVAYYGGPIFVFELTMGLWLLVKGLDANSPASLAPLA